MPRRHGNARPVLPRRQPSVGDPLVPDLEPGVYPRLSTQGLAWLAQVVQRAAP